MLFLQFASFLPFACGRLAAFLRRRNAPQGRHTPLQGLLVKRD